MKKKETNELSKKEILIRGFEIGITGKDTISNQLALAEAMSEINETEKEDLKIGLCFSCSNAQPHGCFPSSSLAMAEYNNFGWCNVVIKCDKYKKK